MRPAEIFGLTYGPLTAPYAVIRQRVYRGVVDAQKTDQSPAEDALSEGVAG
jgi:hypothetical protein